MQYHCISADCHIDLCFLPHDLFVSNASQSMKDRMPYVAAGPEGPKWVTKGGVDLGFANGKGSPGTMASGRKYIPGEEKSSDRIAATGLFEDGRKGIFRPTTPELRLKDQERDGIQAEVMYGLHGAGTKMTDREATAEFYRIYNDWLAKFCSFDRKRFVGLASIPSHSVEAASAEARRVAKLGVGGLDFLASYDMIPLWDPYWDPFWKVAAETNLPVHFHTIGVKREGEPPADAPPFFRYAYRATREAVGHQLSVGMILASVIHGGALERFPALRIVLGESGLGWIPYTLQRMDHQYEERFKPHLPLKMKPSDYWRRQCRATFQDDDIGIKLLDELGVETVMWASDYPHSDGVFPESQQHIRRQFGHLPSSTQRKIVCENAGTFYGLMSA